MSQQLFAFLGTGVVDGVEGRRRGARHALMIFAMASVLDDAQTRAIGAAEDHGWTLVLLEKGMPIPGDSELADETLAEAADAAREGGVAIITYAEEIPDDA